MRFSLGYFFLFVSTIQKYSHIWFYIYLDKESNKMCQDFPFFLTFFLSVSICWWVESYLFKEKFLVLVLDEENDGRIRWRKSIFLLSSYFLFCSVQGSLNYFFFPLCFTLFFDHSHLVMIWFMIFFIHSFFSEWMNYQSINFDPNFFLIFSNHNNHDYHGCVNWDESEFHFFLATRIINIFFSFSFSTRYVECE